MGIPQNKRLISTKLSKLKGWQLGVGNFYGNNVSPSPLLTGNCACHPCRLLKKCNVEVKAHFGLGAWEF